MPSQRNGKQSTQHSKRSIDIVSIQDDSALQLPSEKMSQTMHTSPVVIPPKRSPRVTSPHREPVRKGYKTSRRGGVTSRASSPPQGDHRPIPSSIASILEATAIPVPRRNWTVRESRKLPRGNHVHDFSKLLMDGVDDQVLESTGNTALDILLSPPDDGERSAITSDCDSETLSFSARSMSISSIPSLDNDLDTPSSLPLPYTPSSQRSPSERILRRPSHPESCGLDHPLLEVESSDSEDGHTITSQRSSPLNSKPPKSRISSRSFPRLGSFKSNLTASLRAIKSAAQTVSTFASPSVQPDDFLTRSLFTITPEMTDDRRPPPMNEPPSPALRRYLNPIMVSPAEMYSYQDQPHESLDTRNSPISVQMQTYNRSGKRGFRRGSFQFSGSKGRSRQFLPFDPEMPAISRQREPRENSDFLRMVALEMNMRRKGKLRDDLPTRAKVWLPPRKGSQTRVPPYDYEEDDEEAAIPSRWVGISAESF
ncbi:hypothetical protein ARAM_001316 [Aspergillus rambellii]|uniref:Uncharacterized protein n=3 Tax=Aspergillus subgen. Nidulantes TaxID=2720870 RepID=A0A0F8UVQ7_9EURO|nr:hypothetical protein AOCH_006826 [Aspergillus ochraceoroseus]KKK23573.1 hypothetical protein ARAM_001316 [Aspergillus rambellii]